MNFLNQNFTGKILIIVLLIVCNILFHFIPFERRSIAPDNYAYLVMTKTTNKSADLLYYLLNFTYRPLNHYILDLQGRLAGDNPTIGLFLVFFSSLFVLLIIFFLFNELFGDNFLALIASLIFCLLPNKLETYHNTIFFNINIIIGIYIASLLFYIIFTRRHKWAFFYASLFTYAIGIFWYEVGFFMPIVMITYSFLFGKKSEAKYILYFTIPIIIYLLFRFTAVFGLANMAIFPHKIGLSGFFVNLEELFHQYAGRYIIRSILYGFYKFLSIEQPWLTAIIISNVVLLIVINLLIKNRDLKNIDNRLLIFSGILFSTFLIPFFLHNQGGIGGRHLVLPSIAVVIFVLWLLKQVGRKWQVVFLFFVSLAMIVDQGNAWTQVVACRINGAIYDTIKEKKEELIKADNIIIDTKSFADKIPFTFIQRDFNVLNTYYGAQAFEDRTFESTVKLVTENYEKSVYIATGSPKVIRDKSLEFAISEKTGYRSISKKSIILPQEGTVIIDFKSVYGSDFRNGLRKK